MKSRPILILARVIFISLTVFAIAFIAVNASYNHVTNNHATNNVKKNNTGQHQHVTVNGAANPELVSDVEAYTLLFRYISHYQNPEDQKHVIAYIKQLGIACQTCANANTEMAKADMDALLSAAEEFRNQVSALDKQAMEIKDKNWPNPGAAVMKELTDLQRRKEIIVSAIVASLPERLGSDGLQRLQAHIQNRVKRNTKIFAGPATPPGGPGWK